MHQTHRDSDQPPTVRPPRSRPFVSVIVPVRNEEAFIADTLAQLLHQDYDSRSYEVIVADGESTDRTRQVVRRLQDLHPNLHLVGNPGVWSSSGRNAALEVARGDYVVLVDGHCEMDNPRYLRDLVDAFERSGAHCLGRPQPLDVSRATPVQQAIAMARSSRLGHHPESHIYSSQEGFVQPQSVAVAYRREVFHAVGVFDENFDACEDVEFNHRVAQAGMACFFSPRLTVRYHPRSDLRGLFRQMVRYGRGRIRLLRKHPETFSPMGFVPGLFVLGLVVGPVLSVVLPVLAPVYLACVAFYLAVVLAGSAALAVRERRLALFPWLPAVFVAIHTGAGAGLLREWLAPARSRLPVAPEKDALAETRRAA
jgi:succinoglycan biosynthesis protein ExoA